MSLQGGPGPRAPRNLVSGRPVTLASQTGKARATRLELCEIQKRALPLCSTPSASPSEQEALSSPGTSTEAVGLPSPGTWRVGSGAWAGGSLPGTSTARSRLETKHHVLGFLTLIASHEVVAPWPLCLLPANRMTSHMCLGTQRECPHQPRSGKHRRDNPDPPKEIRAPCGSLFLLPQSRLAQPSVPTDCVTWGNLIQSL